MPHPLVDQLRFTRSEWRRALRGTPPEDALRRLGPMNSIGWIVGHLAWQEQRYWLARRLGELAVPELDELVGNGQPASMPPLPRMIAAWRTVTTTVDPWLETITADELESLLPPPGARRTVGDSIHRVTYHYWFHIGEILAIRQVLGHTRLPEFVGDDFETKAPYRPPS